LKPHFARQVAGFSKVVLFADGDKAGKDLASKFRRALPSSGVVILCQHNSANDVNEIYVQYGKEQLAAMLKESAE
jgi:DNA primase